MSAATFFVCAFAGCFMAQLVFRAVGWTLMSIAMRRLNRDIERAPRADAVEPLAESESVESHRVNCFACGTLICSECGVRL